MGSYKIHFIPVIVSICIILLCNNLDTDNKKESSLFKRNINFNDEWKFKRCQAFEDTIDRYKEIDYNDESWENAILPHTARIEPLVVNDQWQGICWYRKNFTLEKYYREKKIYIEFEAAMQIADVWINGNYKTTHYGGYLPFIIDITDDIFFDKKNVIAVKLNNFDNPEIPPGKPLKELDFCLYGGLYRNVKMHITDKLHITDAVYANKVAGGGIFVRYPSVTDDRAQVRVQTHIINENNEITKCKIITKLLDDRNELVAENTSEEISLKSLEDINVVQTMEIHMPKLWHPYSPYLYRLHSSISQDADIVDKIITPIGIRHISFDTSEGFMINGEKFYLRGTNRHQEYPYIGNALSDNAHYRDALKIKQAGFDFVRLAHYPHAPAFMDACDELGILLMDAIPGWQFFGNELFQRRSYQDCRDMIRRDRNHPSVILWEVSLNESNMTKEFMENSHRIAHEEYPGDQCFTCGWRDYAYDVFIPARQHARTPDYWKKYNKNKPIFIAEYGDWEYYAQNAGFNQTEFKNLLPEERDSRQLRIHGEKRLLQQALNFQEAFNDNLASPAIGCANWLIFDYNRGYANDIEASGIMDIFRIPKFALYFYRSQRPPDAFLNFLVESGPMVFIADYWIENSDLFVKVFSNCQKITLLLKGEEITTQYPDNHINSSNLRYPPFTFKVDRFQAGELEAIGFIEDKKVATHTVTTPLKPYYLRLTMASGGINPEMYKKDVFFVYASIIDENRTLVSTVSNSVTFELTGPGRLIGHNPIEAEAGIASIVVETHGKAGIVEIGASSPGLVTIEPIKITIK